MVLEGGDVTSGEKREEETDLAFGLPHKLLRTDEYPLRTAADDAGLMSSNMSIGGVYDAQDAAARALYPSLLRAQAAGQAGVATAFRYPIFTPAQWQELQRQALIYKHLVACVPVPPDLLFDHRALQTVPPLYSTLARGGFFGLRFPVDSTDPEPGRCKRTDGKKWRCTRDVAPDQKYCERHMHRGRPRSRKPVERSQRNATVTTAPNNTTTDAATTTAVKLPRPEVKLPFLSMVPEKETRYTDWMNVAMEGTVLEGYQDQHQSSGYSDLNDPCYSFLNTDLPSMDKNRDPPRSFIDAWSTEGHGFNDRSIASSSSTRLSPSTLTLSMSGCGEDHEQVQMSLLPTVGGPLGEVLRSGNVVSPTGSYNGLVDLTSKSGSPRESPPRVLSSPTGVLQRTLVSLSDSSSNSSPRFAAGGGRSEVGLQWTAQGKNW